MGCEAAGTGLETGKARPGSARRAQDGSEPLLLRVIGDGEQSWGLALGACEACETTEEGGSRQGPAETLDDRQAAHGTRESPRSQVELQGPSQGGASPFLTLHTSLSMCAGMSPTEKR